MTFFDIIIVVGCLAVIAFLFLNPEKKADDKKKESQRKNGSADDKGMGAIPGLKHSIDDASTMMAGMTDDDDTDDGYADSLPVDKDENRDFDSLPFTERGRSYDPFETQIADIKPYKKN